MRVGLMICVWFTLMKGIIAQEDSVLNKKVFNLNSSITIDNVGNFSGGIKQGFTTLGLFDLGIDINPFQKQTYNNTSLYVHFTKTGGKGASEYFINDVQVASNIEGKSPRFLYELVLRQQLGNFIGSFGLHDLNTEFVVSEYAGEFINSSFGIMPSVSLNVPVSIFPVTTVGGILSYNTTHVDIVGGIYNINHDYVEEEDFNIHNHIYGKGQLGIFEFRYRNTLIGKLNGEYKIGGYYKECNPPDKIHSSLDNCITRRNYGMYFTADQEVMSFAGKYSAGVFTQLGFTPQKTNYVPNYYGFGILIHSENFRFIPEILGLAVGSVGLNKYIPETGYSNPERETVVELTAKKELFNRITIQPDLQYIVNNSGNHANAIAGILRCYIELND